MPYLWSQKPDMRWEPKGDIYLTSHNVDVAKKHFDRLIKEYGNQVVINLIDKKKNQQRLGIEFERIVEEVAKQEVIIFVYQRFILYRAWLLGMYGLISMRNARR